MRVAESVLDLIGETPMVKLSFPEAKAPVYAKLEYLNPGGSIKDRIAKRMVEEAERCGYLKPGCTIVEATSGNTGIALSMVAAAKGYKIVIVMPETASRERISMMKHYGARIVLTPAKSFVEGAVRKAKELAKQPGWWMPSQFENPYNLRAHCEGTGREILAQIPGGKVDVFVAGVGTGGTLMGVAEALKKVNPKTRIVAVEPIGPRQKPLETTPRLSITDHLVEGIGDGFVPIIVKTSLIDEWIQVNDREALEAACRLTREKGLFVGISSGANVYAAIETAKNTGEGEAVVTVLPDSADRYYTTALFRKSCCEKASP